MRRLKLAPAGDFGFGEAKRGPVTLGAAGLVIGAGQLAANALGATSSNPVSGASRAYYRNETAGVGAMATKTAPAPASLGDRDLLAAMRATAIAAQQTKQAIRDKDLSVTVNVRPVVRPTPITIRNIVRSQNVINHYGQVAS